VPIALYMDAHVPRAITVALRIRGVQALTAQEDRAAMYSDDKLLDRATELGHALFTFDDDLLAEAAKRWREGQPFAGIIYAHPLRVTVGQCVRDLALVSQEAQPEEMHNRILFLPL